MSADKPGEEDATVVVKEEETTKSGNETMEENKTESAPKDPAIAYEDDEEEDIPPDFFDDFSNKDFMEGLDIVDTWDDEEVNDESTNYEEDGSKEETTESGATEERKEDSRRSNRHTRITFSKEREREQRMLKYKNYERRYKDLREKLGRVDDKNGGEARRRDPEKTRRDILRDKDRCAKDKEVRIIKERLKVVETGLVPPGMEMEVDLADICSKQNSLKGESRIKFDNSKPAIVDTRPIIKPKVRSRSRSYERYRFRERPLRSRSRSRSRERRRLRDGLSPITRKRLRTRSRSHSPLYDTRYVRDKDRRKGSGERKTSRDIERKVSGERNTSRERKSPRPKRKTRDRSRSRSSNLSDREMWLTRKHRRSFSPRQRSISPDRNRLDYKKDVSRRSDPDPRKEDKPSFLEEIHRKLNETVPQSSRIAVQQAMQLRTTYGAMQPPQPVPLAPPCIRPQLHYTPQMVQPSPYDQTVSQYDQQFFIGTCDVPVVAPQPVRAPVVPFVRPTPVPPPLADPIRPTLPLNRVLLPSTSLRSPNSDYNIVQPTENSSLFPSRAQLEKEKRALEETDKRALSKLLEDKKISLSDFLTITARPSASRRVNLQKKVSVISRCQDAIKELGGEAQSTGRLFIRRGPKSSTLEARHYASPLRKIPIVRLNFTSLVKPEGEIGFSATLNKLLRSIKLPEKEEKSQQFPRIRQRQSRRKQRQQASVDATTPATHLVKMCQTDPYRCEVCQVRGARMFQDQMIQCEIKTSVDVSTQTDESPPLRIKSLSHMTPAEILAEQKIEEPRQIKVESKSDESTEDELDAEGGLQNQERSVELDHGDKDQKPFRDEKYLVWNRENSSLTPRGGGRGGGPPFRGSRGFKSFRGNSRKPTCKEELDIYGPNFDDDEEYVFNRFVPQEQQFKSFDDNYYDQAGPSNQRPFYEPPEHVKRKFNRRFL